MTTGDKINILRIARLNMQLDANSTELRFCIPPCHKEFFLPDQEIDKGVTTGGNAFLNLSFQSRPLWEIKCCTKLYENLNWTLWEDDKGRLVFYMPRESPPFQVIIEPGFTEGEVLGEFSSTGKEDFYPLRSLEIMLFSNWLGIFGDIILHASGFIIDDQGVVFVGSSGAGKSTLASKLVSHSSITVLGEDQVILRYLDGQYWVFGTPWHLQSKMCSPKGIKLKKLFFLNRNEEVGIKSVNPVEGVTRLLQTAFIPYYRQNLLPGILDRLALMAEKIPFYSLSYLLGTDPLSQILND